MENKNPLSSVDYDNFKTQLCIWHSVRCYITLFKSLPLGIKKVAHNTNKFKHELKKFLYKKAVLFC